MTSPFRITRLALCTLTFLPTGLHAASGDAWKAMRADVSAKCLAAAADSLETPTAVVDPFGSPRFGLALVSGKPKGAEGRVTHICVYDKQTKAVEIGSELTGDMLTGDMPESTR